MQLEQRLPLRQTDSQTGRGPLDKARWIPLVFLLPVLKGGEVWGRGEWMGTLQAGGFQTASGPAI